MSHPNEAIVPCPLCGRGFPKFQLQEHANNCLDLQGATPAGAPTTPPTTTYTDPAGNQPAIIAQKSTAPYGTQQGNPPSSQGYGYNGYVASAVTQQPSVANPLTPPPMANYQPQPPSASVSASSHTGPPVRDADPQHKSWGFLPQWTNQRLNVHTHGQPQWGDDAPDVASRDVLAPDQQCKDCGKNIKSCKCGSCQVCQTSVRIGTRHHCRKCWSTTCSNCRTRNRYLNPMSPVNTNALVCHHCAMYTALPRVLPQDANCDHLGLYLLRQVTSLPNRCVGVCGLRQHQNTCTKCSLPTVALDTHLERCVRVHGKKGTELKRNEALMKIEEERRRKENQAVFDALTPEVENRAFNEFCGAMSDSELNQREQALKQAQNSSGDPPGSYPTKQNNTMLPPFLGANTVTTRRILLSAIAASVCYEYEFYPHTTMGLNDFPFAKLLCLKETHQLYSIFEGFVGGKKTIFVALPGTHDVRTVITDVKFSRVHEVKRNPLNQGLPPYSSTPYHGGSTVVWDYKVHTGFHTEEAKLQKVLPTSVCKKYVEDGYHVVFTGHSLGGALASLCCLRHLDDELAIFKDKVSCVTYGAPLIGNSLLTRKIERSGFDSYFNHVVYRSDIVPRLLTGRQLMTRDEVEKTKQQVGDALTSAGERVRGFFRFGNPANAGATSDSPAVSGAVQGTQGVADSAQTLFSDEDEVRPSTSQMRDIEGLELDPAMISATYENNDDVEDSGALPFGSLDQTTPGSLAVASADPSKTINMIRLQRGDQRPFDCYGRYHFLYRDVCYKSTTVPSVAYSTLKSGDGMSVRVGDHLLGSYYKVLTYHFGEEKKRQRERAQSLI